MDNNKNYPVEIERSLQSSKLYIFFGGISAGIAMPPFEFYNSSRILGENKIFVRDFSQCWYHDGLPGISTDIESTVEYLKAQIKCINPDDIFFVGNSMGGYAAMLFATLIGKGEVIAFAPQTFISPSLRIKHRDSRWKGQVWSTYLRSLFKKKVWDIKNLLSTVRYSPRISIFVSRNARLDYIHAMHVENMQNIQIYEFEDGGHGIVIL